MKTTKPFFSPFLQGGSNGNRQRARHWTGTLADKVSGSVRLNFLKFLKCQKFFSYQEEVGEGGLKHIQWYFGSETQWDFKKLSKLYPGVHLEMARSPGHAYDYCLKEESRSPGGDTERSELRPSADGNLGGGGGTYQRLLGRINDGATIFDIEREFPGIAFAKRNEVLGAIARHRSAAILKEQQDYFEKHGTLPTQRAKCQILWGPPGAGKTTIMMGRALKISKEKNLRIYKCQDRQWFQDYQGEEIILIQDMTPHRYDHSWLLNLMDGHNVWFPCKGGGVYGDIDYVFIDSNYDPDTWYAAKRDNPTPQELERAAAVKRRCNEGQDIFKIDNPLLGKVADKKTMYEKLLGASVSRPTKVSKLALATQARRSLTKHKTLSCSVTLQSNLMRCVWPTREPWTRSTMGRNLHLTQKQKPLLFPIRMTFLPCQ